MPLFTYTGRNRSGELVTGVLDGADSGSIADRLFGTGITPIDIGVNSQVAKPQTKEHGGSQLHHKVRHIDLLLFSRQMYTLLKSGVPIMRALAGLQESALSKAFSNVLRGLRESLDAGRELSTSLQRQGNTFSPFYIAMVRVGETTGMLEEIFLRLFHHLEFQKFMRDQVKAAIRYPMFVVATMLVALVIINVMVIPAFAKVYKGFKTDLPAVTQLLIGVSNFMVNYWWLLLGCVIGAAFAFRAWINTPEGSYEWDKLKLRIPIAGKIILKATLARFSRSFALALRSGVPVVNALSLVSQVVENDFLARQIEQMRISVERGEGVWRTAANAKVFTPVVLQMISVGEESGSLDEMMQEVADMYQREVEYELKTLSAQIEPILIVGLGILILIVALGVFLPIWDLGRAAIK